MADVRLVIDGEGLPHAAGYYRTFPHEPSPAGEMLLSKDKTAVLNPISVLKLLDELAKAGSAGTALVVCHGDVHSIRVRIDAGGTFLSQDAVLVIELAERGLDKATIIRAMPEKTEQEKQDKKNEWRALNERLDMRLWGDWTLAEASKQFDIWFADQAGRLSISAGALQRVMSKAKSLRALNLDRLELRACDLGKDPAAMAVLKRFFGCKKFLAPRCRTIYLAPVTVESIDPLVSFAVTGGPSSPQVWQMPGGVWNAHRLPGPHGLGVLTPDQTSGAVSVSGHVVQGKKRSFFNGRSFLTIEIWELEQFVFSASAAAPRPAGLVHGRGPLPAWADEPDWNQVAEIARALFMFSGGNYAGRKFPFAGLWDPPASGFPWIVPNEREYLSMIVEV